VKTQFFLALNKVLYLMMKTRRAYGVKYLTERLIFVILVKVLTISSSINVNKIYILTRQQNLILTMCAIKHEVGTGMKRR
jgi:hypothetical protein